MFAQILVMKATSVKEEALLAVWIAFHKSRYMHGSCFVSSLFQAFQYSFLIYSANIYDSLTITTATKCKDAVQFEDAMGAGFTIQVSCLNWYDAISPHPGIPTYLQERKYHFDWAYAVQALSF